MSAEALVMTAPVAERRAGLGRRGRDRRKPGNRINREAPRRSLMKALGAYGVAFASAILALTLVGGALLHNGAPLVAICLEAAALGLCVLVLGLGSIEQRLIEIRLEMMMANGGRRQEDRRQGDRRAGAPSDAPAA